MTDKRKVKNDMEEGFKKILEAIGDFIFERHRFPAVNDIAEITGIPKQHCRHLINLLVQENRLYVVFEGKGLPTIVLPNYMVQSILMAQKKPDWLANYGFPEKNEISQKIDEFQKNVIMYEQFERLLYTTDISLEEAVAYTLNWLGFQKVVHHKDNPDNPDITFEHEGIKALVEVEGTTKAGDKRKILQLNGWIQRELSEGAEASRLRGFFVVNHFRDVEPSKREGPLTSKAKEFIKYYSIRYFSTVTLFNIVRDVINNKLKKEEAQKKVWEGEQII